MAKAEVDKYVAGFLELKPIISAIKNIVPLAMIQSVQPNPETTDCIIYGFDSDFPSDRFIVMHNAKNIFNLSKALISIPSFTAYSKFVKKTKTTAKVVEGNDQSQDGEIKFNTNGEEYIINIMSTNSVARLLSDKYHILFTNSKITNAVFDIIFDNNTEWISIGKQALNDLKDKKMIYPFITQSVDDGCQMCLSKAVFGTLTKTIDISYISLDSTETSELVLFRQIEDGFDIYNILRFLKF